jgi:hypothetical protein
VIGGTQAADGVLQWALDNIGVGTERLMQRQNAGVLAVSTSLDFAAKWLVHRLARFAAAGLSGRFSIAANVKPRLITSYRHLISPAVLRFGSPVTRGSRFSSRSASGRLMMG